MPIIKSAKKKLRQDKSRALRNKVYRTRLRAAVKEAREKKTMKTVEAAYKALDKAAKKRVIHKNKAARLKSRLVRLVKKKKSKV